MGKPNLKIISLQEFDFLQDKDPVGDYNRETREELQRIIQKLGDQVRNCSGQEKKLYKRFAEANFGILIQEGTESEGKIFHPGAVRVEGRFEGEILTNQTLTVEPKGEVFADISAATLVCRGRIEGEIQALVQVRLLKGATVRGSIFTPSIHIEEGAYFEGRCSMPTHPGEMTSQKKPGPRKFLSAG